MYVPSFFPLFGSRWCKVTNWFSNSTWEILKLSTICFGVTLTLDVGTKSYNIQKPLCLINWLCLLVVFFNKQTINTRYFYKYATLYVIYYDMCDWSVYV